MKIRNGRYKKICVFDAKKKVWINTLNDKQVSAGTAHRYNTRYINLRKTKKPSEITLNELYGNKYKYQQGKNIELQPDKVQEILYRKQQLVKVTTVTGKTKHWSPYFKKYMRPPKAPMQTTIAGVPMLLYRVDRERTRAYHIITWELGKFVMTSPHDVERVKNLILPRFDRILSKIPAKLRTYSFHTKYKHNKPHLTGKVKYIFQKHGAMTSSGRNWAYTRASNLGYVRKQFVHMLDQIKGDFKDGYTQITIKSVYIYIHVDIEDHLRELYGIRSGVRDL